MDANDQQIIDRLDRIETNTQNLLVDVALLKRESETRRIKNYIHYGVVTLLAAVGAWFGYHVSIPSK